MSFLDGAKLICLNENGERGEIFLAKGRKFSFGYYMDCDHVLHDSNAKGLHCEINCDAFGRVTIHNMSEDYPVRVNDREIKIKRPLLSGSKITILGKKYLWENPKGTSSECADINADIISTPQKQVGVPEQPPSSCPELQFHRDVQRRLTVHNFGYCIQSDDEENSLVELDTIQTSELEESPDPEINPTISNIILPIFLPAMDEAGSEEQSVTPEPQINSDYRNYPDETPKMKMINCTQNKENKSTEKNKKLLSFCHQSDIVITSFSPRETGVRNEKSFTAIYKPTTPRSVYSTPKSFLYESNVDDGSQDFIDFSTPATSKKAMKQIVTNSSMHLIDLTTPGKLRPASPQPKSSLKSAAKRNLIQIAVAKDKLQESGLALLGTPSGSNVTQLKTPDSVISVDSTDSSSVVEISEDSLTPSSNASSAPTVTLNKTPSKSIQSKTITTPKRTPHLLMKRAILTSAKKQGIAHGRTDTTPSTSKGTATGTPIIFTPAGTANKQLLARRQSPSTPSKITNVSGKYMGAHPKHIMISSSESQRSYSHSSARRTLSTSTPLRSSAGLRTAAKTSPNLHKVRKVVGGAPLTSHISKIRKSLNLSPKGSMNDDASVSTATTGLIPRKSVCVPSSANARARAIASSILKDTQSTKKLPIELKKEVLFSDMQINSEDSDNLNRTFTMVSDDELGADESATTASKQEFSSINEVVAPKIETDHNTTFSPVKPLIQVGAKECSIEAISGRHCPLEDTEHSSFEEKFKNKDPDITFSPEKLTITDAEQLLTHKTPITQNVSQDAESVTQCSSTDDRSKNEDCSKALSPEKPKILEALEESATSTVLAENSYSKDEKSENVRQIADAKTISIDDDMVSDKNEEDVKSSTKNIIGKTTTNITFNQQTDFKNVKIDYNCLTTVGNSKINDMNKIFSPKKQNVQEALNESRTAIILLEEEAELSEKSNVSETVAGNKAVIENDDLLEEIDEVLNKSDELQKQLSVLESPLEKNTMIIDDKNTGDDCGIEHLSEELDGVERSEYGLILDSVESSLPIKENIPIATEEKATVSNKKLDKKSCSLVRKNEEIIESVGEQEEIRESQLCPTDMKVSSDSKKDKDIISDIRYLMSALTPSETSIQTSVASSHHNKEDEEPALTDVAQHKGNFEKNNQSNKVSLKIAVSDEKTVEREKKEQDVLKAHSALDEKYEQQKTQNLRDSKELLRTPKHQLECEEKYFGVSALLQTPHGANEQQLDDSTSTNCKAKNCTHHLQNFSPRRSTRRASMSASESCLILTPKRISKRRASISIDTEVPMKTPKHTKTPLRKRGIFEEISEDMGAIVEEKSSPLIDKTEFKPKEIGTNKLDTSETKQIMETKKVLLTHQAEFIEESICEVIQSAEDHVIHGNENDPLINSVQVKLVDDTVALSEIDAEVEDGSICEIITASSKKEACASKIALAAFEKEIHGEEKSESKCEILDVSDYGYGKEVKDGINDVTSPESLFEVSSPQILKKQISSCQPFDTSKASEGICKQLEHEDSNELRQSSKAGIKLKINVEFHEDQPSTSADAKFKFNRMGLIPPQNCSTPRTLRKPKMSSTPCLEGIKELMDTSTTDGTSQQSLGTTLIERGLLPNPENLNVMRAELDETVDENLDRFFRTPRAKNIMVLTSPKSVLLKPSKDSVELVHSTEYDLNTTNFDRLDDMFKTPVPNRFDDYIDNLAENPTENSTSKSNDEKTQNLSAEEAFDSFVGQASIIQTPPRNIYSRKLTSTSSTIQQSPFSSTDIISDLPKTDIQEWVDSLEGVEVSEDQQDLEITLADGEEKEQSCDPLAASTIQGTELASITHDTSASENLINVSSAFSVVDPLACSALLTDGQNDTSLCRLGAVGESEISGIDILDQSVDSIFSQPLLVSESDSNLDKTLEEENLTKSKADERDENLEDEFRNFCENPLVDVLGKCLTPNHLERTSKLLRRSLDAQEDLNVTIDFETEREKVMQEKVSLFAIQKKNQNLISEITAGVKELQERTTEVKELQERTTEVKELLETIEECKELFEKTEEAEVLPKSALDITSGTVSGDINKSSELYADIYLNKEEQIFCKETKDGINNSSRQLNEELVKKNESQTPQEQKINFEFERVISDSTENKYQIDAPNEKPCDNDEKTLNNIKNLTSSENVNSESESVNLSNTIINKHKIDVIDDKQTDYEEKILQNTTDAEHNLLKNKQAISSSEKEILSEDIQTETNDNSHFVTSEKDDLTEICAYPTDVEYNKNNTEKDRIFRSIKNVQVAEKSNKIEDASTSTNLDKTQESKAEQIPLDLNKNPEENSKTSNPLDHDKSREEDIKNNAKVSTSASSDNLELMLTSNVIVTENVNCEEISLGPSSSKACESDFNLETKLVTIDGVQTENDTKQATVHHQLEEGVSEAKEASFYVALTKTSESAEIDAPSEMENNQLKETINNDNKISTSDHIDEPTDQEMTEELDIPETHVQPCLTDYGEIRGLLDLKEEYKERNEECDSIKKPIKLSQRRSSRTSADSHCSSHEEEKEVKCRSELIKTQTINETVVESNEPKSFICFSSSSTPKALQSIEKVIVSSTLGDSFRVVEKADSTEKLQIEHKLQDKCALLDDEIKQNKNVEPTVEILQEEIKNKNLGSTLTKQVSGEKITSVVEDIEKETSAPQEKNLENMKTREYLNTKSVQKEPTIHETAKLSIKSHNKNQQMGQRHDVQHNKHDAINSSKTKQIELPKRRGRKGSSSSQYSLHDEDEPRIPKITINVKEETNISERASSLDKGDILFAHNVDNKYEDLIGAVSTSTNISNESGVSGSKSKIINAEFSKIHVLQNENVKEFSDINLNQNQGDVKIVKDKLQHHDEKSDEETTENTSKSDVKIQREVDNKTDVVNAIYIIDESGTDQETDDTHSKNKTPNELNQDLFEDGEQHDIINRSHREDVSKRRGRNGSSSSQISSHDEDGQRGHRNIQTVIIEKTEFNNSQLESTKTLDGILLTLIGEGNGSSLPVTQKPSDDEGELTKDIALESLTKPLEAISGYPIEQNQEHELDSINQIANAICVDIKNNNPNKAPELLNILETAAYKNIQFRKSPDRNECATDELQVNELQVKNKSEVKSNRGDADKNVQSTGKCQVNAMKEDVLDLQINKDHDHVKGVVKSDNKIEETEEEAHNLLKDTEQHFPYKGANRKELPKRRGRICSTNSQNSSHDEDELPKRRAGRRNIQTTITENEESPDEVVALDSLNAGNKKLDLIKTITSKTITSKDEASDNECKIVSSDISNLIENLPPKTSAYINLNRIEEDGTKVVKDKHSSEENVNRGSGGDIGKRGEIKKDDAGTDKTHSKIEKLEDPKLDLIEDPDTTKRTNRKKLPIRSVRKGSTNSQYSSQDEDELPKRRAARRNIQATISEKEELNNLRNASHQIKQQSSDEKVSDKETEVISYSSSSSSTISKTIECIAEDRHSSKEKGLESSSSKEVVNVEMKIDDLNEMSKTPTTIAIDYEISDGKCKLIGTEIYKKQIISAEENDPLKEYDSNRDQNKDTAEAPTNEQNLENAEVLESITKANEADNGSKQVDEKKVDLEKKTGATTSLREEKSNEEQDARSTRRVGRRKKDVRSELEETENKIAKQETVIAEVSVTKKTDTVTVANQQNLADAATRLITAPVEDINTNTGGIRLATYKRGCKATTTSAILCHDDSDPNQSERTEADLHATIDESEPLKTSRGRTRKPTARAQQFLEEERAKASTPKRKLLICASNDSPTPQKMSARRGRKASTIENDVAASDTLHHSDEPIKRSGRGRKLVSEKPSIKHLTVEHETGTEKSEKTKNEDGDTVKSSANHELDENSQKLSKRRGRKDLTNQREDAGSATPQSTSGKRIGRPRRVAAETAANASFKSDTEVSDSLEHKEAKKALVETEDDDDKPVILLLKSPTKNQPSRRGRQASTINREEASSINSQPIKLKRSGRGNKVPVTETHSEGDEEPNSEKNGNDDKPVSSLIDSSKLPARRGRKAFTIESDQIVTATPEQVRKRGGRGRRDIPETASESHSNIEGTKNSTGSKESETITKESERGRGKKNEKEHSTNSPALQKLPPRRGRKASTIDTEGIISVTPQQLIPRGGRGRKAVDEISSEQLNLELGQNANVKHVEEDHDDEILHKSPSSKKLPLRRGRKASTIETEAPIQQQPIRRAGRGRKAAAETITSEQSQSELEHCNSEKHDVSKDNETKKKQRGRVRKHSSSKTEHSDDDVEEPVVKKSNASEKKITSVTAKQTSGRRGRATAFAVNNAEEAILVNSDLDENHPKPMRGRRGTGVAKLQKNIEVLQKREHRMTSASTVESHTDDESEEENNSEKPSTSAAAASKRSAASRKGRNGIASTVSDSPSTKRSKRKLEAGDTTGDVETPSKTRGATRSRKAVSFKSPSLTKGEDQQSNEAPKRSTRTTRKK